MNLKFINISNILSSYYSILKIDKSNVYIFIVFPLLLGFGASFLFYKDNDKVLNVLTLFLSIFIPIFINLLATLISFVMNKIVTRHNRERVPLIKETFYNICYLIPISLLMLSLFMNLTLGKSTHLTVDWKMIHFSITYHRLFYTIIGTFFFGGILHIMLNLLMITKRIFKLFDKEIDLLTNGLVQNGTAQNEPEQDDAVHPADANALQDEE
jgi:hypothetical protein